MFLWRKWTIHMTNGSHRTWVIPKLLQNGNTRDEEIFMEGKTLILLPSYHIYVLHIKIIQCQFVKLAKMPITIDFYLFYFLFFYLFNFFPFFFRNFLCDGKYLGQGASPIAYFSRCVYDVSTFSQHWTWWEHQNSAHIPICATLPPIMRASYMFSYLDLFKNKNTTHSSHQFFFLFYHPSFNFLSPLLLNFELL